MIDTQILIQIGRRPKRRVPPNANVRRQPKAYAGRRRNRAGYPELEIRPSAG